jgi:tetratricopeptide (TPR) repeat protein
MSIRLTIALVIPLSVAGCSGVEEPNSAKAPEQNEPSPEHEAMPAGQSGETELSRSDPIAQAGDALNRRDFDTAMNLAEQALATNPQDAEWLRLSTRIWDGRAYELIEGGDHNAAMPFRLKSAEYWRSLREVKGELDADDQGSFLSALYNEACAYAVLGEREKALESLEEAFREGYAADDIELVDFAKRDIELTNLHDMPEFKAIIDNARKKAAR